MMNSLLSRVVLVAIAFGMALSVNAQEIPTPDASLWSTPNGIGGAINPSGDEAVPAFIYDPMTGDFWLDTLGLNRQLDTALGSDEIGGDDVGFASAILTSPEPQSFFAPTGLEFAPPSVRIDLFRFAPNLTPEDFSDVEMGVNFFPGGPGEIMSGSVQFVEYVPEPSAFLLVAPAIAGFAGIARRRRR